MTDVTRHLGELMGRSGAELAADQKAAQSAQFAQMQTGAPDASAAAQTVAASTPPPLPAGHPLPPVTHAADVASEMGAHASGLEHYAFPFQSHEVFGLLPHSIGAQAEGLWNLAQQLASGTSAVSIAVCGILIGAVVIAIISTARIWRRGEEFAVAGFGDRLTQIGARYTVRQEAPIGAFADKHGVVRRRAEPAPDSAPPVIAEPQAPEAPKPNSGTNWKERREAQAKRADPLPAAPAPAAPRPEVSPPSDKAKESAPAKDGKNKKAAQDEETPVPLVAADETKRPKTVKRKLFRRSATSIDYAGSFHGSYGSFQKTDRLFARDYLKQTNEAFEAAYLKGKGPVLGELRVGDNHRAERLFMMATRSSFDDPQTALAALWQAVDEDRSDAVAWLRLAHFYLELGEFDQARRILEPLLVQAEKLNLDIIVAAAANSLAKIAAQRGETEAARKLFSKAMLHAGKTDNSYMQGVANANAGLLEASCKKFEAARSLLGRGVKGFESCDERVCAARTKLSLGIVHSCLGDEDAAERAWGEAHAAFQNAGLEEDAALAGRWIAGEGTPTGVTL